MISTPYGPFDGPSWELLCQQVFKRRYPGYQPIPASPGDFGIEGFTKPDGCAFQCYCPDKHYTRAELHEHLRDKLTRDLAKLKKNAAHLPTYLGTTKIRRWIFVIPEFGHHNLVAHAQVKEAELRGWNLGFVDDLVTVEVHDGQFYGQEIFQILQEGGGRPALDGLPVVLAPLGDDLSVYEANILRKTQVRLQDRPNAGAALGRLYAWTLKTFLECDDHFRRIEEGMPSVHQRLVRHVNEFEIRMTETCILFTGTAEEMTSMLTQDLESRLVRDMSDVLDGPELSAITRRIVARWLAICSLDYV